MISIPWQDARGRLEAAVAPGCALDGVPLAWPNELFTEPDPPAPYVRVAMDSDSGPARDLQATAFMSEGVLNLFIIAPLYSGTTASRGIADGLVGLFRGVAHPVAYVGATISDGYEDAGSWITPVSINFVYGGA